MRRVFTGWRAGLGKEMVHPQWTDKGRGQFCSNGFQFPSFTPNRKFSASSLENVISVRKAEARRSVIVQVNSEGSAAELYAYCSSFGKILDIHHYRLDDQQHFMLVEFSNESDSNSLLSSGFFLKDQDVIPSQSPFLWFRSNSGCRSDSKRPSEEIKLACVNGCDIPDRKVIYDKLKSADSVSEQIDMLYRLTRLSDLGVRIRFMVARQLEGIFNGLFPDVCVSPFGSSVNGFGKSGCDLDLILKLSPDTVNNIDSRLVFHTKKSLHVGRLQQQKHMEVIGDILHIFLPGCSQVRRILQARIPIIKFNHDYAGMECDLSMGSMSGVYMSELLYLFGCIDRRVKPLIFTVRKWAQSIGITNPSPGKWITNFPLTLLVIFFLQNAKDGAILPSYDYLKKNAGDNDYRMTDDKIDCTFLRDISELQFRSTNDASLQALLLEFFEFYSIFDFSDYAISINAGKSIRKLDHSPLYIVNPLETGLNVSRNVSFDQCERLQIEMKNAAWYVDSKSDKNTNNWGLIGLFMFNEQIMQTVVKEAKNQRLVSIKDLFNDNDTKTQSSVNEESNVSIIKNVDTNKSKNIHTTGLYYKNEMVKNEIEKIKQSKSEELQRQYRFYTTGKHEKVLTKKKTRRR